MSHKNETEVPKTTAKKHHVTTYDSGHEHSIEHWIEVRLMVEEFEEEERVATAKPHAMAAGA